MERLARLVIRRRGIVIGVWLVLTVFGAYSAARVSNRWLESFSIPGYSAYETNQRTLRTYGSGEQFPLVAVISTPGRDVTKVAGVAAAFKAAAAKNPGGRYSDFFTTRDPMYLSKDRATAFAEIFPAGNQGFSTVSTEKPTRAALRQSAPRGIACLPHRPRPALRGVVGRRLGRSERIARGGDRRTRRARDPALRLRHAAGGRDAVARGDRVDPEHVHARLGADVRRRRLDRRAVPHRARRPRRRDRLRPLDDLPLPRGAAARPGLRRRRHHDDAARRPLRDRLGLDRRRRPPEHARDTAAVHPLDRHRRDADSGGVGDRRDHAAARDAVPARARASTACA